jgi:hypothetical protein
MRLTHSRRTLGSWVGLSLFIAATGASAQTASALYDYAVPSGNFNGFTLAKGKLLGITPTPGYRELSTS